MRIEHKHDFLRSANITEYTLEPLPSDASLRRYYRVLTKGVSLILMDCPPEHYSVKPFVNIASLLKAHNLPAPEILFLDSERGFLLLEDFGDVRVKDHLEANPEDIISSYKDAIDLLIEIQKIKTKDLPHHSTEVMLTGLEVFTDWYLQNNDNKST
ncbi:MAG: phosphotransferase, partial [Pseudomonadota bacterium]